MQAAEQGTPRAVLYARVSSEQQADEGTSLETQIEECQKKAKAMGCEVVSEFIDAGVSGDFYKQRPELQRALRMIEAGKADTFIVLNVDRFSRNTEHQQSIKARIEKAGGRLVFCQIDFEQNAEGDLMYGVVGNLASYERKKIAKRTRDGREARARSGNQPARANSPYGFKIVDRKAVMSHEYTQDQIGSYQVVEEEARWVRFIFETYNTGESLRSVCRRLHAEKVPTPKGGDFWRPAVVRMIIMHPAYKGEAYYGKKIREKDEDLLGKGYKHPYLLKANDPGKIISIPCPIIIPPALWESANKRMGEARELYGGRTDRKHMLTGLLRCAQCKRGMRAMGANNKRVYYFCPFAFPSASVTRFICDKTFYPASKSESLVIQGIIEAMKHPELVEAAVASWLQKQEESFDRGEYDRLKIELKDVESKLKAVAVAQVQAIQDGADPSVFRGMVSEYSQQKKDIARRISTLEDQRDEDRIQPPQVSKIVENTLQKLAYVLESVDLTNADKHDLLAKAIRRISPTGEGFSIELLPVACAENSAQSVLHVTT